jgi:hypothetical protein
MGFGRSGRDSLPTQVTPEEAHIQTMLERIRELEEEVRTLRREKGAE